MMTLQIIVYNECNLDHLNKIIPSTTTPTHNLHYHVTKLWTPPPPLVTPYDDLAIPPSPYGRHVIFEWPPKIFSITVSISFKEWY